MGFTWIILLFLQFSGLTTGQECNEADYGETYCKSKWEGWGYNTVNCSIPEDNALTYKKMYELSWCGYWEQQKYTVKSGSVQVWGGCQLRIVFCLKRETTTNTIEPTTTTMTTTSTITTTRPPEAAVVSNTKTLEIILDVFKSTPRSSYDDITRNSSNKFSNVDLKIHSQKVVLKVALPVGIFVLVILLAVLCFVFRRKVKDLMAKPLSHKKVGGQTNESKSKTLEDSSVSKYQPQYEEVGLEKPCDLYDTTYQTLSSDRCNASYDYIMGSNVEIMTSPIARLGETAYENAAI